MFSPEYAAYQVQVRGKIVPLMLMNYVGATKAWLYTPIFQIWVPTATSTRLPVLLLGALTIWLFFRFVERAAGLRAAWLATLLLAADPVFLLTTCFDWGPVAIQHLAVVAGVLLICKFYQTGSLLCQVAGFFFLGLAFWDKAIAIWMLSGLALATLLVYPRELWKTLTPGRAALATAGFVVGALPLIAYNIAFPWETFRGNTTFTLDGIGQKIYLFRNCLEGNSLMGSLVDLVPQGPERAPETAIEKASLALNRLAGEPAKGPGYWAFLAAVALVPFLWFTASRRLVLFSLIVMAVAWIQMAITKGAGGGTHHTILLWPFPTLVVALAITEVARRVPKGNWIAGLIAVILIGGNVLVINTYLSRFIRFGSPTVWNDASFGLSDWIGQHKPATVYIADWGMWDTLRMLHQGRLHVEIAVDPMWAESVSGDEKDRVRRRMEDPGAVFTGYTEGKESFKSVKPLLAREAAEAGLRKEILETIYDRNRRPVYEVYHFVPAVLDKDGKR